ncbi:50S ribosomal protein L32e [Candidatus Woesearchaeota archaeon]|nr:50S ribosomal protein L32e [Candidatus Woesearchaeota archaeon]
MMKQLLELRKAMNAKRPKFEISSGHKRKKLAGCSWRRPRGHQNKERLGKYGKKAVVSIGYRGPVAVRNLSASGKAAVHIFNVADLANIDPKNQCAIIARIGMKNLAAVLNECKAKNIEVVNHKIDASLKKIQEFLDKRKKAKMPKKEKKKPAPKKEAKKTEEIPDEDKKEAERKEMEKVLTRR